MVECSIVDRMIRVRFPITAPLHNALAIPFIRGADRAVKVTDCKSVGQPW